MNDGTPARLAAIAPFSRRVRWRTNAAFCAFAALVLISAGAVRADPIYSYTATVISGAEGIDFTATDSSGTSLQNVFSSPNAPSGTAAAFTHVSFGVDAEPGILGAVSNVGSVAGTTGTGGLVLATSSMQLDNILISGAPVGTPVLYTVNFNIAGSITVGHFGPAEEQGGVQLRYSSAATPLGDTVLGGLGVLDPATPGTVGSGTGIFAGFPETDDSTVPMSVSGTTPAAPGVVGGDAFVEFVLETSADVNVSPGENGQVTVDFQDPFSFPTSGPVFNFFDPTTGAPLAGITANSDDGCIVDNRFVCGTAAVASVPEPNACGILLLALALTGFVANRRKPPSIVT